MITFWKDSVCEQREAGYSRSLYFQTHRVAAFDVTLAENSPAQNTNKTCRSRPVRDTSVEREMSDRQGCACEVNYSCLESCTGRIL